MNVKKGLGILVCVMIAFAATWLGGLQKIMGAPMIGLLIGMLIVNLMPAVDKDFKAGTTWSAKKLLSLGIILAGGTLNFTQVVGVGAKALPLILFNILLAYAVAFVIGKKLGLSKNTSILVGGGSCICGGTAIATLSTIIKAKEEEIAYAMTAIFLFDIFSALSYPYLFTALGFTANQFSFMAGTAINDTSSVVAAQSTYNVLHGLDLDLALTIKLTRTTMLIALAVIFTIMMVRSEATGGRKTAGGGSVGATVLKVFPWFILWYVLMALLNTLGVFDAVSGALGLEGKMTVGSLLGTGYKFLVAAALAGVGFKIQFKDLFTKGIKPIMLGGLTWCSVAIASFLFVQVFSAYVG